MPYLSTQSLQPKDECISIDPLIVPFHASLRLPGSKSHANRAIIAACLCEGKTTLIDNATPCDDVSLMVENLQKMGFDIEWTQKSEGKLRIRGGISITNQQPITNNQKLVTHYPLPAICDHQIVLRHRTGESPLHIHSSIKPASPKPETRTPETSELTNQQPITNNQKPIPRTLHCGNAGTTLRFLTSLCAVTPGEWIVTGDAHMQRRPIADLVSTLRALGADITDTAGCPPIRIRGKSLVGGSVTLDASKSSQFLSSLLLIAPTLSDGLRVSLASTLASPGYIDLTRKVMQDFGVRVDEVSNTFIVQYQRYGSVHLQEESCSRLQIEGDWSAAGAWVALSEMTGSKIFFEGVNTKSVQSDSAIVEVMASLRTPGDITLDCFDIPDQVMNIAVCAAFREGTVTITGAANLRLKECNRLAVITSELKKVGIDIHEHDDGVIIHGRKHHTLVNQKLETRSPKTSEFKNQKPITKNQKLVSLDPHDDHRMAMCFAVLGCVLPGIRIVHPQCVSKSYPHFFEDLRFVRSQTKPIAIVGMRAIGKSTLARRLAARLKLAFLDTDKQFERLHGKIPEYVQQHGWDAFRKEEEIIVSACLLPGTVVSLGGGALESDRTRNVIKEKSIVIWMQASEKLILQRLKITKRPKLTDLPIEQEVRITMQRRDPQYREVASIHMPADTPFRRQVSFVVEKLRICNRLPLSLS